MKEHVWLKRYPKGIPHAINPEEYKSVLELFEECVDKFGDSPAFENMGKRISYNQLNTYSEQFAAYLQTSTQLEKGDRIAIQMPNLLQYVVVMFGALRAGLVVVNTNPLYTAREMKHQFKDSGASAIVILANFAHNLEKVLPETSIKTVIVTEIGDMLGGFKGILVNWVVKNIKKMVPSYRLKGAINFKQAMTLGASASYARPSIESSDIAFLQYTGGTTGVSKGAMLLHRNIVANMEQISTWFTPRLGSKSEIVITPLPLYHIFALTVNCLAMLKLGALNVLITNPRDMPAFIKELNNHPFTVITGVNTLFNGLLNQPSFAAVDFSSLKVAVGGGMAVQKSVALKWKEVTGVPLVEGYGLTEASPVLTSNPVTGDEKLGSIGLPLPSTQVAIFDENDQEVPMGEVGELYAKGPQVMPGYWQRPAETEKTMHGDWLKTGDMAVASEDGFFAIVDRKKDMILVSGFNVYPNEIEDVIATHPKVLEVAAVGIPDQKSTEAVKVFIVKKDLSLTEEEIVSYCRENLTGYKCPKQVEFRTELPKSNIGKILRKNLKEED
jgi:long-chain acyl-CoA synthetase